jgi:Immunity protein 26
VTIRTNLQVLKRSNRPPVGGDVFFMQLPNGLYLFGRVIFADVPQSRAPMPGANLIYVYDVQSPMQQPDYAELLPNKLLIPPLWTNKLPWTKGYFQHVENRPLGDFELLRRHCFRRAPVGPNSSPKFVDESGVELAERIEPCGEWGLVSYRWIDDHLSDALGMRRVPDESRE